MNIPETILPFLMPVIAIALIVVFHRLGMFKPDTTYKDAEREAARHSHTIKEK